MLLVVIKVLLKGAFLGVGMEEAIINLNKTTDLTPTPQFCSKKMLTKTEGKIFLGFLSFRKTVSLNLFFLMTDLKPHFFLHNK